MEREHIGNGHSFNMKQSINAWRFPAMNQTQGQGHKDTVCWHRVRRHRRVMNSWVVVRITDPIEQQNWACASVTMILKGKMVKLI